MVEADLDPATRRLRRLRDPADVVDPDPCGLLDEDVRRRPERRARVLGEAVVRHRDDHGIETVCEHLVERAARRAAEPVGERPGRPLVEIEAGNEAVTVERRSALVPHQPAADDADAERTPLRLRRGHVYSTP